MVKFIQEAFKHSKKGSLHRELHIPQTEKIDESVLRYILKTEVGKSILVYGHHLRINSHLHKQANFLLNLDKSRK